MEPREPAKHRVSQEQGRGPSLGQAVGSPLDTGQWCPQPQLQHGSCLSCPVYTSSWARPAQQILPSPRSRAERSSVTWGPAPSIYTLPTGCSSRHVLPQVARPRVCVCPPVRPGAAGTGPGPTHLIPHVPSPRMKAFPGTYLPPRCLCKSLPPSQEPRASTAFLKSPLVALTRSDCASL